MAKAKYTDPKVMQAQIDAYFEDMKAKDELPSFSGLALDLGFSEPASVWAYGEKPPFTQTIKKARNRVIRVVEQRLLSGKPPIGLIFWLKNNAGWADKQEFDMTTNGKDIGVVQLPARISTK